MAVFIFVLILLATQLFSNQVREEISASAVDRNETNTILQFRELLGDELYRDYMKSDVYLRRWLRVNDFDVPTTAEKLRTMLKWRKDNKIDGILEEHLKDNKPYSFHGVDFEGSTVIAAQIAQFDTRALLVAGKRDIQVRAFAQLLETAETIVLERLGLHKNSSAGARPATTKNSPAEKLTVIGDVKGFNKRQHVCPNCFAVYLDMFQIMELYYPGYVKLFLFINVPTIFHPLLEMVKPILSEEHRKAMRVYGANKAIWMKELGKILPMDSMSYAYGGNLP